jgi:hypothetical protein
MQFGRLTTPLTTSKRTLSVMPTWLHARRSTKLMQSSVESNYQPSSLSPRASYGNVPTRLRYLLVVNNGKILADLNHSCPMWSPSPLEAVERGMAWSSMTVAIQKLKEAREILPDDDLHLARLTLMSHSAGQWTPTWLTIFP